MTIRSAISPSHAPLLLLLLLALLLPSLGRAQDEQPNRAGLVIQHGDGRVATFCVSFGEPAISGIDLIERAGVGYLAQSSGMGAAVCKLDGEGCDYPAEECFCRCKGADCAYWSYHRLREGAWAYSQLGAASAVQPGEVDGWVWGATGARPPALSFDQICAATPAEPAPPTVPPPPPPAETPLPVAPQPTATLRPTLPPSPPAESVVVAPTATAAPATAVLPATTAPTATATPPLTSTPAPPTAQPPAAVAPTLAPRATAAPAGMAAPTPARQDNAGTTNYLIFGALVVVLLLGIIATLVRR